MHMYIIHIYISHVTFMCSLDEDLFLNIHATLYKITSVERSTGKFITVFPQRFKITIDLIFIPPSCKAAIRMTIP